jgi:hypothetical protein
MLKPSFKSIGRAAGYTVWEGLPRKWFWQDQFRWSKEQSDFDFISGFDFESRAWQDCCIKTGLVTSDEKHELTHKFFARSGGYFAWQDSPGKWRWHDQYGWNKQSSNADFPSEEAAYEDCCRVIGLTA